MEDKSYEQMRKEFETFFASKIQPDIANIEKERKNKVNDKYSALAYFVTLIGGCLLVLLPLLLIIIAVIFMFFPQYSNIPVNFFNFINQFSYLIFFIVPILFLIILLYRLNLNNKNKKCNNGGYSELDLSNPISMILALILGLFSFIFSKKYKKGVDNNITTVDNASNNTSLDIEKATKEKYKDKFIKIFANNAKWSKNFKWSYLSKYKIYRKINIFNPFPYIQFDDVINMNIKETNIGIYEINTALFAGNMKIIIPILFIFCLCFFNFLFLLVMIVSLIILAKKIYSYSPFRGIVVELKMNKKFKGHTFFIDNSNNSKKIKINKKKFKIVNLESVDFSKKYTTYSTDQIEARYLLTTAMIERLDNLKLSFNAQYIRGSFKDNKLILAIATNKDMFTMENDFQETNYKTFETLFNEIISIIQIIDQLKLYDKTGL